MSGAAERSGVRRALRAVTLPQPWATWAARGLVPAFSGLGPPGDLQPGDFLALVASPRFVAGEWLAAARGARACAAFAVGAVGPDPVLEAFVRAFDLGDSPAELAALADASAPRGAVVGVAVFRGGSPWGFMDPVAIEPLPCEAPPGVAGPWPLEPTVLAALRPRWREASARRAASGGGAP